MKNKALLLKGIILLVSLPIHAQTNELNHLYKEAVKASKNNNVLNADSLYKLFVDKHIEQKHEPNYNLSEAYIYLSRRAASKGNVQESIALQKKVVDIRSNATDCTKAQWASSLSDLASLYAQKGDYGQAINIGKKALEELNKIYGEKHEFYNIALLNLASYYSSRGERDDYEHAVEIGELALKHLKKGTIEYANALNGLAVFYSQTGELSKSNKLAIEARKVAHKRLKTDDIKYATILNNQAIKLAASDNYLQAIEFCNEAKNILEKINANNTLFYSKILSNLSTFYTHNHNFQVAASLLETAKPIIEKALGANHPDYLRCLSDLSTIYKNAGNLEKADLFANESEKKSRAFGNLDNAKYAKTLSKQANVFASNGNYSRAIKQEWNAYAIFTQRKDSQNIAVSLGNLAMLYYYNQKPDSAFEMASKALGIFQRNTQNSILYAQALNNISILYYYSQDYHTASLYSRKALSIYQGKNETESSNYAKILTNMGLFAYMSDSTDIAILYTHQAHDLQSRLLGDDHPDNIPLLHNLSVFYCKKGNYRIAENYYHQALSMQSQQIRTNFLHLTSAERERYWNNKNYIFKYAPMLAYYDDTNEQIATDTYNSLLFKKGLLLNSDVDFKSLLKKSGNFSMLEKYNLLCNLLEQKDALYKLPVEERGGRLSTLNNDIYEIERELLIGCKEYGNFTDNLNIDVKKISNALKEDDIAIEFTDIDVEGIGKTYIALCLRKNWKSPRIVKLFSDPDLEKLNYSEKNFYQSLKNKTDINNIYNNKALGKLLWEPLIKHFTGIHNIYFSPSGIFYQLGIEYLFCDDNYRINDCYNVFRLSSTKQLVQIPSDSIINKAIIYGGLKYDMTLAEIKEEHSRFIHNKATILQNNNEGFETNNINNSNNIEDNSFQVTKQLESRGSVKFLEGTLQEAKAIGEQLMLNDIDTDLFLDIEGTEESFKSLSGLNTSIIHIATHGFYIPQNELNQNNKTFAFLNNYHTEFSDNELNYSGLLFAGANYRLNHHELPKELEDGILTSREIAQLDLSAAQLIVLSACQTGLGDIKEDGVFGIQRGFKKAGANTLLMSLWSVSDSATALMMTSFYTHLMEGHQKHDAFLLAQQELRENGFNEPFFWASFILLDDI